MKLTSTIARILLGAIFVFFGSNHLLHFLPSPPPPAGVGGQFIGALMASGYMAVVAVCEVVPGVLLLINRYVPLALMVLGAVIFNILVTDVLFARVGLPMGTVLIVFWCFAAWQVRSALFSLVRARVPDSPGSRKLDHPARIKPAA